MRRFAVDVLATSQRLAAAGVGPSSTPVWHAALLTHPPAPLKPSFKKSTRKLAFAEDRLRERFFQDFPFEALRPKVLAERDMVQDAPRGPTGKDWWKLEQRSRNPSSEDCIAFALNLQEHHDLPAAPAYAIASAQFAHLRAIGEVAARAAWREARAYGADYAMRAGELARHNRTAENALRKWRPKGVDFHAKVPAAVMGETGGAGDAQGASQAAAGAQAQPGQRNPFSTPDRKGRSQASLQTWELDASPSLRQLEGSFSGGEHWVKGWESWRSWVSERKAQKVAYNTRARAKAKR